MCIIYPSRARPWRSTSTLVLRSCRVFVLVQSRPMKKSCPSKGACFSKAHNNIHETSCVTKFCLGRRIKQPQMDNLYRFSPNLTDSRPMGTLHVALTMRYHGVSKTLSPSKVRTCPFQSPCPPLRHWPRPRVASLPATLIRGSAQRQISNVPAKRDAPPRRACRGSLIK